MADSKRFNCENCSVPFEPSPTPAVCGNCGAALPMIAVEVPMRPPGQPDPPSTPPAHQPGNTSIEVGDRDGDDDDPWGDEDVFADLSGAAVTQPPSSGPFVPVHTPQETAGHPQTPTGQPAPPSRTSPHGAPQVPWTAASAAATSTWRLHLASPDLVIDVPPGAGVLLGRDPSSPIKAHPSVTRWVSSAHARVRADVVNPDVVWVEDLGSTNGTWIAGTKLLPGVPMVVQEGDVIMLASQNPVRIEVTR
jgi:hypothetical protein